MSFVDDRHGWAACDDGSVLRTTDSGGTWHRQQIVPAVNTTPVLFIHYISIHALRNGALFVSAALHSSAAILRSSDLARTWTVVHRTDRASLQSVWFIDDRKGWAVGWTAPPGQSERAVIYSTQDGGHTWNPQYLADTSLDYFSEVRFADATTGWVVGGRDVVHTVDSGTTWKAQSVPGDAYLFGLDAVSPTEAWVVGSDGVILHTVDGGTTWLQSKLPARFGSPLLNSVKFIDPRHGWVVGNDGLIFGTADGGATWRLESKGRSSYLRGLTSTKRYVFTYGNDGIILRRTVGQVRPPRQPN